MWLENVLAGLVAVAAPIGLLHSWYFYFAKLRRGPSDWRNRVTLASLLLVTSLILGWSELEAKVRVNLSQLACKLIKQTRSIIFALGIKAEEFVLMQNEPIPEPLVIVARSHGVQIKSAE
jgi:hypothetical protein